MTCDDALALVEPVAAGDLPVSDALRVHLETCPRCAAALATAHRIESALAAQPERLAPARFTPQVLARIRTERWRAEQHVDRVFNVAIVAAVVLIAGGILALTNLSSVLPAATRGGVLLKFALEEGVKQAAPALATYIAAAGLLVSALAMWWWAERRFTA
jgi:anti-sigma factor RsiW